MHLTGQPSAPARDRSAPCDDDPAMGSPEERDQPKPLVLHLGRDELVIRRRYEVLSIVNDILVALWFAVGSVLFFFVELVPVGTWLFLIGSVQLLIRPLIRLHRRIILRRVGTGAVTETARDF